MLVRNKKQKKDQKKKREARKTKRTNLCDTISVFSSLVFSSTEWQTMTDAG